MKAAEFESKANRRAEEARNYAARMGVIVGDLPGDPDLEYTDIFAGPGFQCDGVIAFTAGCRAALGAYMDIFEPAGASLIRGDADVYMRPSERPDAKEIVGKHEARQVWPVQIHLIPTIGEDFDVYVRWYTQLRSGFIVQISVKVLDGMNWCKLYSNRIVGSIATCETTPPPDGRISYASGTPGTPGQTFFYWDAASGPLWTNKRS